MANSSWMNRWKKIQLMSGSRELPGCVEHFCEKCVDVIDAKIRDLEDCTGKNLKERNDG
ncbi:hypothetical protein LCGC14_1947430 [marine sediment metagenome]|uniref:Uncharacterized protein n=1 Tax=marine sediment metagenome TaxID=412755 RepID=A0A0F9FID6_9ZZZZ